MRCPECGSSRVRDLTMSTNSTDGIQYIYCFDCRKIYPVEGQVSVDWILCELGEVYKHAHNIAMRTRHPNALKILNLCNEMATQYIKETVDKKTRIIAEGER